MVAVLILFALGVAAIPAHYQGDSGLNKITDKLLLIVLAASCVGYGLAHLTDVLNRHARPTARRLLRLFRTPLEVIRQRLLLLSRTLLAAYSIVSLVWAVRARFDDDAGCGVPGDGPSEDDELVNPDIGGVGVRSAYYITGFTTIVATVLCHFSRGRSGIKELGVTQLVFLICIVINLAKSDDALHSQEVLIACMLLDGVSAAALITFSQKEALASRLYILISILSQGFAIILFGVKVASLPSLPRDSSGCCYPMVWWGITDTCKGPCATFWWYYTLRLCNLLYAAWRCLSLTRPFDWAAKKRMEVDAHPNPRRRARQIYGSMPATTLSRYVDWIPSVLLSAVSIESALRRFGLSNSNKMGDWGQSVQVVACALGILHLIYIFYGNFRPRFSNTTPAIQDPVSAIESHFWSIRPPQILLHDRMVLDEQSAVELPPPAPTEGEQSDVESPPPSPITANRRLSRNPSGTYYWVNTTINDDPTLRLFFGNKQDFLQKLTRKVVSFEGGLETDHGDEDLLNKMVQVSLHQQVIYCDDSSSMRRKSGPAMTSLNFLRAESLWDVQKELILQIAKITTRILPDGEGVALRFINQDVDNSINLTFDELREIVNPMKCSGNTNLGTQLRSKILEPLVYSKIGSNTLERPLLITILIGSAPQPENCSELTNAILECGRELNFAGYPRDSVKFMIGHIGMGIEVERFMDSLRWNRDISPVVFVTGAGLDRTILEFNVNLQWEGVWLMEALFSPLEQAKYYVY